MISVFHFTMTRLGPGSVIQPGNWGRLLRRYQHKPMPNLPQFGGPWIISRELILELSRLRHAPTAPSRFDAAFVLADADVAERYRASNDPNRTQTLHEVELVDPEAPSHLGSLAMTAWPMPFEFIDPMTAMADAYWLGHGGGDHEIVTLSALRVIKCID
jgi:hypothetical protein